VTGITDPRTRPGFDLGSEEGRAELTSLLGEVEALFLGGTTSGWIAKLQAGGVPCGPLNFPPEAMRHPQLVENDFVVELEHPLFGAYKTFGPAVRMDATPVRIRGSAPLLDEHTDAALADVGFSPAEIAALRESGVAGAANRPARDAP
jgi:formyl-CoA transferase